ncbi:MAG: hypothetical protein AB7P03_07805 [Kofleriaceae bacterium]
MMRRSLLVPRLTRTPIVLGLLAGGLAVGCGTSMGGDGNGDGNGNGNGGVDANDTAVQTRPVRTLPGLQGINFWERTGGTGPTKYAFTVDGPELTTHLADPMTVSSHDIPGAEGEFYDVYYSNSAGEFELDGPYLTISGVYLRGKPAGGGLNLSEIELVFAAGQGSEYGNVVTSYVALGDNKDESRVNACIDGDLQTHTAMGNTIGANQRLRLTLGFASTVIIQ